MYVSLRAIVLCKIASLREGAAGRRALPYDQRESAKLKIVALATFLTL